MRRLSRIAAMFVAVAATIAGVQFGGIAPAGADTEPIAITGNVWLHSEPNTSVSTRLVVMPQGSHPDYVCYTRSEDVGGTNVWFDVRWNGTEGFYSSYVDDVPLSAQSNLEGNYGIHYCGTGSEMNQGAGAGGTITLPPAQTPTYDRNAAVNWALAHAQDPQALLWSQCAWFVSNTLWNGGFARNSDWTDEGEHGDHIKVPGTVIATGAPNLVDYLVGNGWATRHDITANLHSNAVPDARPGDIIAYDWTNNGQIDHLALVVDIAPGNYPEVAEWGTADGVLQKVSSYQKRGWTYSQKNHIWLQWEKDHGNMQAYLIHINF